MGTPLENAAPDYMEAPLGEFLDMVASRFSTEHLADADGLAGRADGLRGEVALLARADAAAYGRVLDAYRTTRDDEEARRRKIREAQSEAADVPLSITEIGAEVAGISARLAEEGNPNLRGTP